MLTIVTSRPAASMAGSPRHARRLVPALAPGRGWRAGAACLALLAAGACRTIRRPDPSDLRPLPPTPGHGLTGTRVIVLPLSSVRGGDTFGWAATITDPRASLIQINAEIARALSAHASRTLWIFPAEITRVATRNPGYLPDPYGTDPSQFAPDRYHAGSKLVDPIGSDLRTYTSFLDARVALVPVELRFFPRPVPLGRVPVGHEVVRADSLNHMGRAVMRIALVDTRSMVVFWVSDVLSDPAPAFSPAVIANLADRVAQALSEQ